MIRRKSAGMFALMFVLTGINTSLQPYYAAEARQEQTQEILEHAKDEMIAGEYVPGEAIVTLDAVGPTTLTREGTASFDSHIQIEAVYDFGESENDKNKNSYVVHLSSDKYTTEELMERALDFYYVDNVSANGYQHLCSDAFTDYQWYLDGNSTQMTTASPGIRYSQMTATTKETPVIAVLDTGVNYNHEDLKDQMWVNPYPDTLDGVYGYDYANGDADPMDTYGHGTHVAGIAAATKDNGIGITGIASAKIMALKVCRDQSANLEDAAIIAAFSYVAKAMEAGVNVVAVNCSWGGNYDTSGAMNSAINQIGELGALTIFAAGNDGVNHDDGSRTTPYDLDSPYKVIVGASDYADEAAFFSDYGKQTVDLFAPGTNMLSAYTQKAYLPQVVDTSTRKRTSIYYNSFSEQAGNVMIASQTYQDVYTAAQLGLPTYYSTQAEIVTDAYNSYEKLTVTLNDVTQMFYDPAMEQAGSIYVDVTDLNPDPNAVYEVSLLEGQSTGGNIVWEDMHLKSTPSETRFFYKDGRTYFRLVGLQIPIVWSNIGKPQTLLIDDIAISVANLDQSEYVEYAITNGSSMAAPVVSAATAIIKSANPTLSGTQLRSMLLQCVRASEHLTDKCITGSVIDLAKVYNRATAIKLNKTVTTVSYAKTKTVQLKAKVTPSYTTNAKVVWKVNNTNYATVDSNGKVRLKKAAIGHNVWVAATTTDGTKLKAKCKIKVKK